MPKPIPDRDIDIHAGPRPTPNPTLSHLLAALLWVTLGLSALVFAGSLIGGGRSGYATDELRRNFVGLEDTVTETGAALCMAVAAAGLYLGSIRRRD